MITHSQGLPVHGKEQVSEVFYVGEGSRQRQELFLCFLLVFVLTVGVGICSFRSILACFAGI